MMTVAVGVYSQQPVGKRSEATQIILASHHFLAWLARRCLVSFPLRASSAHPKNGDGERRNRYAAISRRMEPCLSSTMAPSSQMRHRRSIRQLSIVAMQVQPDYSASLWQALPFFEKA